MGYLGDIFGIFLLKDESYRKVGNDGDSFIRLFLGWMVSSYLALAIIGMFSLMIFRTMFSINIVKPYCLFGLAFFVFFPAITFLFSFIITFVPHLIGLLLGGRPRNYFDFFSVLNYAYPVMIPIAVLFGEVFVSIFALWWFFILYMTYRRIHMLSPCKAGWAVAINLILYLMLIFFIVGSVMFLVRLYPAILGTFF